MAWPETVRKSDLIIEFYRGSGPGGQHRNKTNSACRITHKPTGLAATAEDERCQHKNKRTAFRRLASKLVPIMKSSAKANIPDSRSDVRVRTYHSVRNQVKDDRTDKVWSYTDVIEGNALTEIINEVVKSEANNG